MTKKFTNRVENTSDTASNPRKCALFLASGALYGGPQAITAQNIAGLQQLLESDLLPVRGAFQQDRSRLLQLGFNFGLIVEADPLFVEAQLPPGWSKGDVGERGFSILDEQQRPRFSVFYKAAFYDRQASMNVRSRWTIEALFDEDETPWVLRDNACKCTVLEGTHRECLNRLQELSAGDYFDDWAAASAP